MNMEQKNEQETQQAKSKRTVVSDSMLFDVSVQHPQHNCLRYGWDRERDCLRVTGVQPATPGLPADLATLRLPGQVDVPVLVLTPSSSPPGTLVQARLLGALRDNSPEAEGEGEGEGTFPLEGWILVAVAGIDTTFSGCGSLEQLPPAHLAQLQTYVQARILTQAKEQGQQSYEEVREVREVSLCDMETSARRLREARVFLKREQRARPRGKEWLKREKEEKPVTWRAIEGLSESLRAEMLKKAVSDTAPYAQAEHLIRFVPQRFQQALADLLLDDERLLAFVERPLLQHRTGVLGMQTWRSNEGLLLITDRQVLWLRDFLSPGSGFLQGGYIAHSAPLERLKRVELLPTGKVPDEFADRLESRNSPYLRLMMEVESRMGSELFVVEFPLQPEVEKALARILSLLSSFLPSPEGKEDRRLRRLPVVELWQPQGAEAERLAGLGGLVSPEVAEPLEQRLVRLLQQTNDERLISALVPALEDYQSPARLVALTRSAVLILENTGRKQHRLLTAQEEQMVQVHRYELTTISSAQLRYSLVGASLSLFLPQPDGRAQQQLIPFQSPALAWFLPLFTRLRIALSGPY